MKIEENTIAEDKQIDIYNLHIEDQKQPSLVEKWCSRHAEAKKKKRELERQVEIVFAQKALQIRLDPEEFNLDKKPTETAIKLLVHIDEDYCKIFDDYLQAKYEVDVMDTAVKTIYDKRLSIDGEIKLYLNNYYSRGSSTDSDFADDGIVKGKEKQKKLMRRSKKNDG
jgi:hypothetical protein